MPDESTQGGGSIDRTPRPAANVPQSVLTTLAERTGEAPHISLREQDSAEGGSPPIDPRSDERLSSPAGRSAYQVQGEIARGGMGVVLRAHDTDLGRDVAMKVLAQRLSDRPDVVQRFVEEAQIGGQLQHPGIVPVYELGLMADERPYFTMKLVKGETLAMLLAERSGPTADRRRLLDVFLSVCRTVAYAHSRGVIHRDLKPANVMVGKFGEVQVVDWGLAKVLARGGVADEKRAREVRSELTVLETVRSDGSSSGTDSMVGSVLGTPAYMPPEQASGQVDRLDERTDVFALGAILCEILTGSPPYARESDETLMQAAQGELDDAYARLDACGAAPDLIKLARQCLVAAKGARPRNAAVVADTIEAHLVSVEERAQAAVVEAAEARVHAEEERKARRLTLALAAAVVALVAVGGGGLAWREHNQRTEIERIERGLDEVRGQVLALQAEGRDADAVRTAQTSLVLVDGRAQDDFLRTRAANLIAEAEGAADRAEAERARVAAELAAERARAEHDAALLAKLEELRLLSSLPAFEVTDAAFHQAFEEWGVDFADDVELVMETLRASRMASDVAPALDDWATVRRRIFGSRSFEAEELNAVAADLDPDELRNDLREALMDEDVEHLLTVAGDILDIDLEATTANLLGNGLIDLDRPLAASQVLERATSLYPGDLRLRVSAAYAAIRSGLLDLARGHLSAARSIRPDLAELAFLEASRLEDVGRYPAAARAARRTLELDPDHADALLVLGRSLAALGRYEGAAEAYDRYLEQHELAVEGPAMSTAQFVFFQVGRIDQDTLYEVMDEVVEGPPGLPKYLFQALWGLEAKGATIADMMEVEEALGRVQWAAQGARIVFPLVRADMLLRLGRPEEALRSCDISFAERTGLDHPTERMLDLILRIRALVQLDRLDEARALFLFVETTMNEVIREDPEAWADSWEVEELEQIRGLVAQ